MSTLQIRLPVERVYSHLVDYFEPKDMMFGANDLRHPDDKTPDNTPKRDMTSEESRDEANAVGRFLADLTEPDFR